MKSTYRELVAPDTVQRDLKGAVQELHEKTYRLGEQGAPVLSAEKIVRFDRAGYQVLELTVDVAGSGRNTEIRIYDALLDFVRQETGYEKRVEVRLVQTDPAKKQVTWRAPDAAGRLIPAKEVTYDAFRKVGAGRDYDATGRLTQSYRVTRDARGLGTEILFMDATGRVKYRSVPTWDETGLMRGSVDEFVDDHTTAVRKFEPVKRDAAGNWTELRKGGKFVDREGEHPAPTEVIVRELKYFE